MPEQLGAPPRFADPGRLHHGSDRPSTKAGAFGRRLRELEATPLPGELDRRAAMRGNAELLFPNRLIRETPSP